MANYANIGWIDEESELNGIYVRRDEYNVKGEIGTYNSAVGDFAVLPPGTAGQVLTADPASDYGLSWEDPSGETITAGIPAAQSGLSRLTIVDSGDSTTLAIAQTGVGNGSVGGPAIIPVIAYSDTGQILAVGTAAAVNAGASGAETLASGLTINSGSVALANSGVIPNTYATTTSVPQITVDARGRITAAANLPITFPTLAAGVSGLETGASGLTLTGASIALSNIIGLIPGNYGNSTNTPSFVVDTRGRITAIGNTPINFPAAPDQLASVATRSWGAGTGRNTGTQDNVAVGDNAQTIGQQAVAIGRNSLAQTLGVSIGNGARASVANSTIVGPLIIADASNCVFIGGNISSLAQNPTATGNCALGFNVFNNLTNGQNNVAAGLGPLALATTASGNIAVGLNAGANITTSSNNVLIGRNTGTNQTTGLAGSGLNTCIGDSAQIGTTVQSQGTQVGANTLTTTQSTALGANAQANGVASTALGFGSVAGSTNSLALGTAVNASGGVNAVAIGNNITNNLANSCLIGNNNGVNYITRTNGYFRSQRSLGAAAGQIAGDALQLFSAGPTLISLLSTRFDDFPTDGLSSVDLVNSRMFLGVQANDTGAMFQVFAMVRGSTTAASAMFALSVTQTAPGIVPTTFVVGDQTAMANGTSLLSISVNTIVKVPNATTGRNYIECFLTRVSGSGNLQADQVRIAVARIN